MAKYKKSKWRKRRSYKTKKYSKVTNKKIAKVVNKQLKKNVEKKYIIEQGHAGTVFGREGIILSPWDGLENSFN